MPGSLPLAAREWSLLLILTGLAVLIASPFLARYHTRRRHLPVRGTRLIRLNLLYNGAATTLAGVLNLYGQGIAGWLLLVSTIVATLAVSVTANRLSST